MRNQTQKTRAIIDRKPPLMVNYQYNNKEVIILGFDFGNLDLSKLGRISEALTQALKNADFSNSDDEIIDELFSHYQILVKSATGKKKHKEVTISRDNPRVVTVDNQAYDFDEIFCHDDRKETNSLCAIDCLLADFGDDEAALSEIEKMFNNK